MSFDTFDFSSLADISLSDISFDAIDVSSFTDVAGFEGLSNIGDFSSFDVQSLTTFAENSWSTVTDFSGVGEWWDATNPGSILGSANPIGGFDLGEFAGVDAAVAAQSALNSGSILDKAGSLLESGYNTISKSAGDLVTSTIKQVSDPAFQKSIATSFIKSVAPQLVSQVAGTGAVGQLVNRSINTAISNSTATASGTPVVAARTGQVESPSPPPVGFDTVLDEETGTYSVVNAATGDVVEKGLTVDEAITTAQQQTDAATGEQPPVTAPGDTRVAATSAVSNTDSFGLNILSDVETNALIRNNINPAFINGLLPVALTETEIALARAAAAAGTTLTAPGAVIEDPFGASRLAAEAALNAAGPTEQDVIDAVQRENAASTSAFIKQAQQQQTIRVQRQNKAQSSDWRVRLRLAPRSNYLYNAPNPGPLLQPLRVTDGVIFPYTPQIDTAYKANYSSYDLTHSNYRGYFYQNSYVDAINIRAMFTAQDTFEADYLLGVIHFFRSATKMFYGQDDAAKRGAPPPMVYLSGLGDFQFNEHPCLIQQFNYTLPSDVDYIRAQSTLVDGQNLITKRDKQNIPSNPLSYALQRLKTSGLTKGGMDLRPLGVNISQSGNPTYVPTKMEMSITLLPTQSRSQVSDQFSVENFANGNLLKGGFW